MHHCSTCSAYLYFHCISLYWLNVNPSPTVYGRLVNSTVCNAGSPVVWLIHCTVRSLKNCILDVGNVLVLSTCAHFNSERWSRFPRISGLTIGFTARLPPFSAHYRDIMGLRLGIKWGENGVVKFDRNCTVWMDGWINEWWHSISRDALESRL